MIEESDIEIQCCNDDELPDDIVADCDECGNTGMQFEGDIHIGDCPFCCGGTL